MYQLSCIRGDSSGETMKYIAQSVPISTYSPSHSIHLKIQIIIHVHEYIS